MITKRIFSVSHRPVKEYNIDFILLPLGYRYNTEFLEAKTGDIIQFFDGEKHMIYSVGSISSKTKVADILSVACYGKPIMRVKQLWRNEMVKLGHREDSITDQILVIGYGKAAEE